MTTSETNSSAHQYVGFWKRFLAFIIDMVVLYTVGYFLFGPEVMQEGGRTVTTVSYSGWRGLIPILYFYLSWLFLEASPAGWALRTKIIEMDGGKLSWSKALLRLIGTIPSMLVLALGFFWIGFDKKKQGWHDKIGKTLVVKR